ncbi:alkaline phosphatase [Adhaeribacter arboris]|uniref:Alkaline phosphatase n=1 Tax=Adhaeribacter arboris TaxID=2072846 RepID=A0A2T2YBD4_9BACT|nr:phosphatidylinositol-specific phospholipase C/glycerophosphodiester phosphodiesterase family protein [Adhaeribacter arboris]PSR52817.1 alkaline phosphatase [Adhaeribacter arboris]
MRQSTIILFFLLFIDQHLRAQRVYTAANVHAHNDYQQSLPFFNAYTHQVGSIEADLFLQDNELYVAHEAKEISPERTLDVLYLQPLQAQIKKNKGSAYPHSTAILQILIDLKTNGTTTLPVLMRKLANYPEIRNNPTIQLVISGERPNPETWSKYPSYIYFDATPGVNYTAEQLKKIRLFSASFRSYSQWNGEGSLEAAAEAKIRQAIDSAHQLNKKWRFWATPDNANTWQTLMQFKVDFIGTDDVTGLTSYLNKLPTNKNNSPRKN